MHNFWPTIGEVNERRQNYRFGLIKGERRAFGRCDIARITLYMEATHGIGLSAAQRDLFHTWHRDDPPGAAERRRHATIGRLQGRRNPWISGPNTM